MSVEDTVSTVVETAKRRVLEIVSQDTTFDQCMFHLNQVRQSNVSYNVLKEIAAKIQERAFNLAVGIEELLKLLTVADQRWARKITERALEQSFVHDVYVRILQVRIQQQGEISRVEESLFERVVNTSPSFEEKMEIFKLVAGSALENKVMGKIVEHFSESDNVGKIFEDLTLILRDPPE